MLEDSFLLNLIFILGMPVAFGFLIATSMVDAWEIESHYRNVMIRTEKVLKTKHPHASKKTYGLATYLFAIDNHLQKKRSPR